ncbi:hypothetical protein, partial [Streptomyces sp. NPDC003719]
HSSSRPWGTAKSATSKDGGALMRVPARFGVPTPARPLPARFRPATHRRTARIRAGHPPDRTGPPGVTLRHPAFAPGKPRTVVRVTLLTGG